MIDLAAISPAAGAKYSPSLHAYLKRQAKFGRTPRAFFIDCDGGAMHRILIGTVPKNWPDDVIGARLGDILHSRRRPESHYTGRWNPRPLPGFFAGYQKWGRCFLDPSHVWLFDDRRWRNIFDIRVCLWCGIEQRKVKTERVVVDERWVAA